MEFFETTNTYNLEIENELRIFVGDETPYVKVKLKKGSAEVFGTEMKFRKTYIFPTNTSIAIFTWYGCTIKVTGCPRFVKVFTDTHMILNLHLHADLERQRMKAEKEDTKGPITLIVGPRDVGKTTLCRVLLNYATRSGRRPLFIDLDVEQNSVSLPGAISANIVRKPSGIFTGFKNKAIQVYYFGYEHPVYNIALYSLLMKKLGQTLQSRLKQINYNTKFSGTIIKSCSWTREDGYGSITLAAMTFKIDVLCVLHDELLYLQLLNDMPSCVRVIFMPKLDGIVKRSPRARYGYRDTLVREYFYGLSNKMEPYTFDVKYSEMLVFKVIPQEDNLESFNDVTLNSVTLVPVPLSLDLVDQILAISSADTIEKDAILAHVDGFMCITAVNLNTDIITVMSSQPSPLPKKMLFISDATIRG